jgi:hypothetical protein
MSIASRFAAGCFAALLISLVSLGFAQEPATAPEPPSTQPEAKAKDTAGDRLRPRNRANTTSAGPSLDIVPLVTRGVEHILSVQEGDTKAEWPYEGVYRVQRQIPIGYRVGGTAICATALIRAPGYNEDRPRKEAVHRAIRFIIDSVPHPLMNPDYNGGYDVRGWGYTCGLAFLLELKARNLVPTDLADGVEKAILHNIDAIQRTEITQVGGWNYARQTGRDAVSPPSPFMTGPTLQALFEAKRQGYAIDPSVVDRAIATLEQARTPSGSIRYSGVNGAASGESVANVRAAVDAFIVHWEWLEKRRAQPGTHQPPYGIAPYYFYYAHYYAAQAVEMLPERERPEYRRRIADLIMKTRREDGTWNDRVFERTSNYSTAMSIMALMMPDTPTAAAWQPE